MSAPFPSDLTAAPTGGAVAWVFDARGTRNVWIAEPPDYRGRAVTSYAGDDGQEITDLAYAPDGKSLVYVRGGPPNREGEIPNPTSDPAGSTQAVHAVAVGGGEPRRLGDGAGQAVSPRGDRIAFVQKDKVWWAKLDRSDKPAQAFQARGSCGNLRWSADGSRLAFLRIPSSPTAREFLRPHREGPPWSVRVVDMASGQAREVFRADAGRGSVFREIVSPDQLVWADGDRIVFPWEKDGWTHLYAVGAGGGPPALLTPGEFEVEDVRVSPGCRRKCSRRSRIVTSSSPCRASCAESSASDASFSSTSRSARRRPSPST